MIIDITAQFIYSSTKNTVLTANLFQTLITTCSNFICEVNEFQDLNCELSETSYVKFFITLSCMQRDIEAFIMWVSAVLLFDEVFTTALVYYTLELHPYLIWHSNEIFNTY